MTVVLFGVVVGLSFVVILQAQRIRRMDRLLRESSRWIGPVDVDLRDAERAPVWRIQR